jgi:hypothetical protein
MTTCRSRFYTDAIEVYDVVNDATTEGQEIAAFWSDDPNTARAFDLDRHPGSRARKGVAHDRSRNLREGGDGRR